MKKSIVFVISAMSRGGAERVISVLSNYCVNHGYEVSIVMLWHNYVEYNIDAKVKIVDLSNDKINPLFRLISVERRLRKYLKATKPYAVISFIAQNNLISSIACRRLKTRFIPSERIDPASCEYNALLKRLLRKVYGKSSVTVMQTERAKSFFSKKVQENCVVIENPIEVKQYAEVSFEKEFVTAGRLKKQKNHELLIKAFKTVSDKHSDFTLTIYGEGPERSKLENLVSKLGLTEKVKLPGNVPDIHNRIKNSYAFVLSSDYEGLSNALLEAMMMGLPCISTDCAGSDEAIQSGENGILVPVGDEEKLGQVMLELAEDEEYRNILGVNAKKSAEQYKAENVIGKWIDVIEGV